MKITTTLTPANSALTISGSVLSLVTLLSKAGAPGANGIDGSGFIAVADYASLPQPGVEGTLYLTEDTDQFWRWDPETPDYHHVSCGTVSAETTAGFPATGIAGITYLATTTGKIYYWDGAYIQIIPTEYNGIKYAINPTNVQTDEGNTFWNADDHCLDTYTGLGGVVVQNGQELLLLGYVPANATTIPDGVPVSIDGSSGLRPIVYQTDVTNEASCRCFAGLSTMEITPGNHGFINLKGLVRGVNTAALEEGDRLWATNTTPFLTNVEPTSGQRVLVGVVLTKSANGLIYSSPRHFELTAENKNLLDGMTKNATFAKTSMSTGFIDGENIVIAYNKTANTITLTHASGKIEYFFHGNYHYLTSPWTSSAHGAGDGMFFLSSTDGTTFSWSNTLWELYHVQVALAYVKAGSYDFAVREPHGLMPWESHRADHNKRGTYRISGLGPTDGTYTLNTATDAATTPGFNSGVITDEDNQTTIPATTEGTYSTLRVGAANATVIDTAATFPFRSAGSYILINNPLTGAETATTTNRYLNVYELLVPATSDADSQAYRRLLVQPQTSFASLAAAQAEDTRTLLLGDFGILAQELVYYTRITYVTSAGDLNTGKCRIAGFSYVIGDRNSQINVSATIAATTAENVTVDASGFDGNLAPTDTNLQLVAQKVDDLVLGSVGAIDWENPVAVAGATTLTIGKHHVCTGTTADYTVTLPAVSGNSGKLISIEMSATLTKLVTVDGNASETIDGATTRVMWAKETAILRCDGLSWTKVAGKSIPMTFSAYLSANATGKASSAYSQVLFDAEVSDPSNMFASSVATIKRPATWQMYGRCLTKDPTDLKSSLRRITRLYKNGSPDLTIGDDFYTVAAGSGAGPGGVVYPVLTTGDVIALYTYVVTTDGVTYQQYGGATVGARCELSGIEVITW